MSLSFSFRFSYNSLNLLFLIALFPYFLTILVPSLSHIVFLSNASPLMSSRATPFPSLPRILLINPPNFNYAPPPLLLVLVPFPCIFPLPFPLIIHFPIIPCTVPHLKCSDPFSHFTCFIPPYAPYSFPPHHLVASHPINSIFNTKIPLLSRGNRVLYLPTFVQCSVHSSVIVITLLLPPQFLLTSFHIHLAFRRRHSC
jgi:hypothetical protein